MELTNAARKLTLPIGVIGAVGLGWLTFWSVRETQQQAARVQGASAAPSGPAIRSRVTYQRVSAADQGRELWSLAFDEIDLESGGRTVSAEGLRDGVVYDLKSGKPQLRVTAQAAEYDTQSRNFHLFGPVTAVFSSGTVATMDEAEYVEAERKLICRGSITVRGEDYTGSAPLAIAWADRNLVTCPEGGVVVLNDGTRLMGRVVEYDTDTGRVAVRGVSGTFDLEALKKRAREEGKRK
jgi:lipopolysaccharide export system protein LptA